MFYDLSSLVWKQTGLLKKFIVFFIYYYLTPAAAVRKVGSTDKILGLKTKPRRNGENIGFEKRKCEIKVLVYTYFLIFFHF